MAPTDVPPTDRLTVEQALRQAIALHQSGDLRAAELLYRSIINARPDHPDANHNLGVLAVQSHHSLVAVPYFKLALETNPHKYQYWISLLEVLIRTDQIDAARHVLMQGRQRGLHGDAIDAIASRIDQRLPHLDSTMAGSASAELQQLATLFQARRYREAEQLARQLIDRNPQDGTAWKVLGVVLQLQGCTKESLAPMQTAVKLLPMDAEAHCNLGITLNELNQLKSAESCHRKALEINPKYAPAHCNLGVALVSQGHLDHAEGHFRHALEINPDYSEAHCNLGNALKDLGRLGEAEASYRRALELEPDYAEAHSNLLFTLNYASGHNPADHLADARRYGQMVTCRAGDRRYNSWRCAPSPQRLRVGLVSGDLRNHPVGYFLESVLAQISTARIELIAYPSSHCEDELTARVKPCFSAWKPLTGMSDEVAAGLIHDDGVHLLMDLSAHSANNRLPLFAWKPAPVQATWLGYPGTTGVAEIDYLLGDPYVTPTGEAGHFTESIWRLPESYLCFTPPAVPVDCAPLPALTADRITFGSFNNLTKMGDDVVALWSRVLHAVSDSVLFLRTSQLAIEIVRESTIRRFAAHDIAPCRLILDGTYTSREGLLAAYNLIDIALDPFPHTGITTSAESLWMGVPFITLRGDRFHAHAGESILRNAGLSEWIASDYDDYVAKAVGHASDMRRLSTLRAGLRRQVSASPLFDAHRFARHLEEALLGMWTLSRPSTFQQR